MLGVWYLLSETRVFIEWEVLAVNGTSVVMTFLLD